MDHSLFLLLLNGRFARPPDGGARTKLPCRFLSPDLMCAIRMMDAQTALVRVRPTGPARFRMGSSGNLWVRNIGWWTPRRRTPGFVFEYGHRVYLVV